MAVAMKTRGSWSCWKRVFTVLAAGVSLFWMLSCLSDHDAPVGARAKNPRPRAPTPEAPVEEAKEESRPPSEGPFTPLDKAIADDCLPLLGVGLVESRAWSQDVPERECTGDDQCGDGFCDRGRCAAIWTCSHAYGQRCIDGRTTAPSRGRRSRGCIGLCLEGRCRSCTSDAECAAQYGSSNFVCSSGRELSGGRACRSSWIKPPFEP
jgi:hypothetical protein